MTNEMANPVLGEDENPSASPAENVDEPSHEGGNTPAEIPYHKDPRWMEMYEKAKSVDSLQQEMGELRERLEAKEAKSAEPEQIPSWFYGDENAWNEYKNATTKEREQMKTDILAEIKSQQEEELKMEESAVNEWKEFFDNEIATLKEDGYDFDEKALKDYVVDNEIVDSRGVFDLKRGLMKMQGGIKPNPARKQVASMASSKSNAEPETQDFATPEDFEGSGRPW